MKTQNYLGNFTFYRVHSNLPKVEIIKMCSVSVSFFSCVFWDIFAWAIFLKIGYHNKKFHLFFFFLFKSLVFIIGVNEHAHYDVVFNLLFGWLTFGFDFVDFFMTHFHFEVSHDVENKPYLLHLYLEKGHK